MFVFKYFPGLESICLKFKYFQVLSRSVGTLYERPNKIEEYCINIAEKQFPTKRHVSRLYKRLTTNIIQNTGDIKGKWELELNTIIEDDLCERRHKGINSQLWKEFDRNVKMRYFNVISTYVKEPSVALCWRKCGDHTHIFGIAQRLKNLGKISIDTRGRNTSRSSGVFIGSIA